MAPDAHCRAALRLHRPTFYGPSPSSRVPRPGKAQPTPGKIVAHGAGCPLPGGAALAPACGLSPSSRTRRPGKAQPPPGSAFTLPVLLLAEDAQYILTMLQQLRVIAVAGKGQRQRELGDNPSRTRRHHQHPLAQQQRLFDIVGH